jgi:hypothetical protein
MFFFALKDTQKAEILTEPYILSPTQFFDMKKLFAKLGMPSLMTVALVLGGLFFSSSSAQAQTLTGSQQPNTGIKTTATWKNSSAATQVLTAEIQYLDGLLQGPNGTLESKMKYEIYLSVRTNIENGLEVPKAALAGFYQHAPGQMEDDQVTPGMSAAAWTSIYNSMIDLLTL